MTTSTLQSNGTYTLTAPTGGSLASPGLSSNNQNQLNASYDAGTNSGGSATKSLTNGTSVLGSLPDTGSTLSSSLNASFAPTQNTIMQNYEAANNALTARAGSTQQAITDTGNYNLGYENTQDKNLGTQQLEGRSGFITNPGAIVALQTQADKRVRDLTTQMNDALASNNTQLASSLAQNVAAEQSAITQARTAFLSQYFGSQQETRSQAEFPLTMQKDATDIANAVATGQLTQAQAVVALKQVGLTDAQVTEALASANAANASAGLSGAQARYQNTLTDFIGPSGTISKSDPDVQYLLNGGTVEGLQSRYAGTPQAVKIPKIIAAAQSYGYNQNQANLNFQGESGLNQAANSGNPFSMLGAGTTNLLNNAGSKLFGNNSSASPFNTSLGSGVNLTGTSGKTPSGIQYTITP